MRQFIPLVLVLLLCLLCGQVSSYLVITDRAEWTFTVSVPRYISITDAYAEKTDTGWLVIVEYAFTEEPGMDSISITLPTSAPSPPPTSAPSSTPTSAPSTAPSPTHIIFSEEISDEVETTEVETLAERNTP